MTNRTFPRRSAVALAITAAAFLGACASTPPTNARLDQAHAEYSAASSNPQVVRAAPAELRRAEEALQQADTAWRDKKDAPTVDHFAYLASQRVASAQQAAQLATAEQAITSNGAQRDRILIDARTQEADAQRSRADAEQAQAQQARRVAADQAMAADAARQQAAASADRAAALQSELLAMNAQQTQRGLVLTLGDVLFDTGRSTLNPGAGHTIDQLAQFLKENPERTVQVEGYTDSVRFRRAEPDLVGRKSAQRQERADGSGDRPRSRRSARFRQEQPGGDQCDRGGPTAEPSDRDRRLEHRTVLMD